MTVKRITALLLALVMVFAFAACGGSQPAQQPGSGSSSGSTGGGTTGGGTTGGGTTAAPPPAEETKFSFTYATPNSGESPTWLTIEKPFLDMLISDSGGRLEFVEYLGGSLLGSGAVYNGIMDGSVDMGFDMPANIAGQFPVTSLLEQAGAGSLNATVGAAVSYEFKNTYIPNIAEYEGMKVLWITDAGPATLTGTKPLRTIDDIKGKQIRTNAVYNTAIDALGGTPVIMNMSEVYEAFSTNLLDAGWFVADAMLSFSLQEVADYCTIWPFNHSIIFCTIKQDTFDSLPADLQKVIDDACVRIYEEVLLGQIDGNRENSLAKAQSDNPKLEIINMSAADLAKVTETLAPLFGQYADSLDSQGYDGTGIMNWIKECAARNNGKYA
ncbi:MAG: TRAP transporter substrate-binding protein DctP [Oscillospiraceae bacterium]|nr:TRAP transporter substrate-binding protein DctP [Oscillospiraceae bacterium]